MLKTVTQKVIEIEGEDLQALLGKKVLLMCMNYNYAGTLIGVSDTCVLLEEPKIVYETGKWSDSGWKDAQALPTKEWYVQKASIESYGEVKK